MHMQLVFVVARLKARQYVPKTDSPNLILAKSSRYTVCNFSYIQGTLHKYRLHNGVKVSMQFTLQARGGVRSIETEPRCITDLYNAYTGHVEILVSYPDSSESLSQDYINTYRCIS